MKREATEHPKLVELVDALEQLGVQHPKAVAKGVLEGLWHFTAKYAPAGNIGRFGDKAIARACGWEGDPADLIAALLGPGDGDGSGWLDRHPVHRIVVHDWSEHADDAVHRQLARRIDHFSDGSRPNLRRFGESERNRITAEFERIEECAQNAPIGAHAGRTPGALRAPRQSPAPPEPRQSQKREESPTASAPHSRANGSRAPRGKKKPPSDRALRLTDLLAELLRATNAPARFGPRWRTSWAAEIDRLIRDQADVAARPDSEREQYVEAGIRWVQSEANLSQGRFALVVHCGRSLREKWPNIVAAAKRSTEHGPGKRQAFRDEMARRMGVS